MYWKQKTKSSGVCWLMCLSGSVHECRMYDVASTMAEVVKCTDATGCLRSS